MQSILRGAGNVNRSDLSRLGYAPGHEILRILPSSRPSVSRFTVATDPTPATAALASSSASPALPGRRRHPLAFLQGFEGEIGIMAKWQGQADTMNLALAVKSDKLRWRSRLASLARGQPSFKGFLVLKHPRKALRGYRRFLRTQVKDAIVRSQHRSASSSSRWYRNGARRPAALENRQAAAQDGEERHH